MLNFYINLSYTNTIFRLFKVFLTEPSLRELDTVNEGFTEEDLMVPESRSGDDFDDDGNQSDQSGMSGVSSISEADEHDVDYDTDLDMEEDSMN